MSVFLSRNIRNFADVKLALEELPSQRVGNASAVCETGEVYTEFFEYGLARPKDAEVIERLVAQRMWRSLDLYLSARNGTVYWRVPFEHEIGQTNVVVRYDEDGTDVDPITERKCVMDKDWIKIACYCRLYRATCPVPLIEVGRIAA